MGEDKSQDKADLDEDLSRDRSVHGKDMNANAASRERPVDRVTVPEAAKMMGGTQSAIRKRVHRGTIPWDKDHEGRIYVYVEPSEMRPETRGGKARDTSAGQSGEELVEAYRDQVEFLRRELERKDTLLMSLMQCTGRRSTERSKGRTPSCSPLRQRCRQRRGTFYRGA